MKDFVAANPTIDPRMILSRFIIADRFEITGNTEKVNLPKIYLDGVDWSR